MIKRKEVLTLMETKTILSIVVVAFILASGIWLWIKNKQK